MQDEILSGVLRALSDTAPVWMPKLLLSGLKPGFVIGEEFSSERQFCSDRCTFIESLFWFWTEITKLPFPFLGQLHTEQWGVPACTFLQFFRLWRLSERTSQHLASLLQSLFCLVLNPLLLLLLLLPLTPTAAVPWASFMTHTHCPAFGCRTLAAAESKDLASVQREQSDVRTN